jgi:EpsI family protein
MRSDGLISFRIAAALTLLLGVQIAVPRVLSFRDRPVLTPELSSLSAEIGNWKQVGELSLDPDVVAYLRPDEYVERGYRREATAAGIDLFIAYFKSVKSGYAPHSPAVCLPGNGWISRQHDIVFLRGAGQFASVPVNQYVLEKNGERLLVFYWYQNRRHTWAEEFWQKLYLLPDLIRYHRSDVALIRLVARVANDDVTATKMASVDFFHAVFPMITERLSAVD